MSEVIPQYEVLFNDLKNHSVGSFLVSREFKLFMSEQGYFDKWSELFKKVEENRTYYAFGMDHEPEDATNTFALYLNAIQQNKKVEFVASSIICKLIEWTKEKGDFSNVLQSMKIAKFQSDNIDLVNHSVELHNKKKFVKKDIKPSKQKRAKSINNMSSGDIFIVHGHNEEIKSKVVRALEKLKLKPIILHEQSDEGLTIIEKFEKHSNVKFAIILLTFDDFGNSKADEKPNKRARQNVILELGYFIAKLSRKNVLCLYEAEVELPSDILAVLHTKIDDSENWKFKMVKELKSAGFIIDADELL